MYIEVYKCISHSHSPLYERVFEGEYDCQTATQLVSELNSYGHTLFRADTIENNDVILYQNELLKVKYSDEIPVYFEVLPEYEADTFHQRVFVDEGLVKTMYIKRFTYPFETYIEPEKAKHLFADFIGDVINLNGENHIIKIYYNKKIPISAEITNSFNILNREYKGMFIYSDFVVVEIENGNIVSMSNDVSEYFNHLFYDYFIPFVPTKKARKNTVQVLSDKEVLAYV